MLELILYFQSILSIGLSIYAIIEIKSVKKSTHRVIMPTAMVQNESPRSQMLNDEFDKATGSNMFLDEDSLI
jgi:hypothetical protein